MPQALVVAAVVHLPLIVLYVSRFLSNTSVCVRADFRSARAGQKWARLLQEDRLHQPLPRQPHLSAPLRPSGPAPVQRGSLPGEAGQQDALRPAESML